MDLAAINWGTLGPVGILIFAALSVFQYLQKSKAVPANTQPSAQPAAAQPSTQGIIGSGAILSLILQLIQVIKDSKKPKAQQTMMHDDTESEAALAVLAGVIKGDADLKTKFTSLLQ